MNAIDPLWQGIILMLIVVGLFWGSVEWLRATDQRLKQLAKQHQERENNVIPFHESKRIPEDEKQ